MVLIEKVVSEPAWPSDGRCTPPLPPSRAPSRNASISGSRPNSSSSQRLIVHLPAVPASADTSRVATPATGTSRQSIRRNVAKRARPTRSISVSEIHVGSEPLSRMMSMTDVSASAVTSMLPPGSTAGGVLIRNGSHAGALPGHHHHHYSPFRSGFASSRGGSGGCGAFGASRCGSFARPELPQNHPAMTPPIYHSKGTALSASRGRLGTHSLVPTAASGFSRSQLSRPGSSAGLMSASMAMEKDAFLSRCCAADAKTAHSTSTPRLLMGSRSAADPQLLPSRGQQAHDVFASVPRANSRSATPDLIASMSSSSAAVGPHVQQTQVKKGEPEAEDASSSLLASAAARDASAADALQAAPQEAAFRGCPMTTLRVASAGRRRRSPRAPGSNSLVHPGGSHTAAAPTAVLGGDDDGAPGARRHAVRRDLDERNGGFDGSSRVLWRTEEMSVHRDPAVLLGVGFSSGEELKQPKIVLKTRIEAQQSSAGIAISKNGV